MRKIDQLLKIVRQANASDLHLNVCTVPIVRVDAQLEKTRTSKLTEELTKA